jgi:hypothetical protein
MVLLYMRMSAEVLGEWRMTYLRHTWPHAHTGTQATHVRRLRRGPGVVEAAPVQAPRRIHH